MPRMPKRPSFRPCPNCGMSVRSPQWLCSRCQALHGPLTARRLADTDAQIQALRRDIGAACVAIASSLDALPSGSVSPDLRVRWRQAVRGGRDALGLVEERLAV